MITTRVFSKEGYTTIDGKMLPYHVSQTIGVVFHEKDEWWACPTLFGPQVTMSWKDLHKKIMRKLSTDAKVAVRRQYLEELKAKEKAERDASAVHVDVSPKTPHEAFG